MRKSCAIFVKGIHDIRHRRYVGAFFLYYTDNKIFRNFINKYERGNILFVTSVGQSESLAEIEPTTTVLNVENILCDNKESNMISSSERNKKGRMFYLSLAWDKEKISVYRTAVLNLCNFV